MTQNMQRRMQEKLDGLLNDEQVAELFAYLQEDEDAAQEYARLEQLDDHFTQAAPERAPERLALTILARLSQTIEMEAQLQGMPEASRQALMLSLGLVVIAMMPTMLAASWLVLNAGYDAQLLTHVLNRTIGLLTMLLDAIAYLLEEIEHLLHEDSQLAPAVMTLLPAMFQTLLDALEADAETLKQFAAVAD